jgi:hypothetical protein
MALLMEKWNNLYVYGSREFNSVGTKGQIAQLTGKRFGQEGAFVWKIKLRAGVIFKTLWTHDESEVQKVILERC